MTAEPCLLSASASHPPLQSLLLERKCKCAGFCECTHLESKVERGTCIALLSVCCLCVSAHVFVHTEMLSRGICCRATNWPWLCPGWWQQCVSWSLEWNQACRERDEGPGMLGARDALLPLQLGLPEPAQPGSVQKLGHHTPTNLSSDKTVSSGCRLGQALKGSCHSSLRHLPLWMLPFLPAAAADAVKEKLVLSSCTALARFLCFCLHRFHLTFASGLHDALATCLCVCLFACVSVCECENEERRLHPRLKIWQICYCKCIHIVYSHFPLVRHPKNQAECTAEISAIFLPITS